MKTKEAIMIGGPNGAGKTTAAFRLLPADLHIREFVNADEIARGLSPLNPEGSAVAAGRLLIERIATLVQARESFAFETTCSGRGHVRTLKACRDAGYRLTPIFLWLQSPEMAVARVARRVSEGGHAVAKDVIVRRYRAGLRNMRHLYLPPVDVATIYDNSNGDTVLIAERRRSAPLVIHDKARWSQIEGATR